MSYQDDEFKDLIDQEIKTIIFNDKNLLFGLKDGSIIEFLAVGDCCSNSYIESLDNPEIFRDATLVSVESVEGETESIVEDGWQIEVYQWTFYKFKTTKGMCTLSFRNESNGYYDGYLERVSK